MATNSIVIFIGLTILIGLLLALKIFNPSHNNEWQLVARKKLSSLKRSQRNNLEAQKQLIIELDKLLDYCLKNKKLKGESMGERLKSARKLLDKNHYNNVWEAHKVRNKLVHEIDFKTTFDSLNRHNKNFQHAIEYLVK